MSPCAKKTGTAIWLGTLLLALPILGQQVKEDAAPLRLEAASAAKAGKEANLEITPKTHICEHLGNISCGQTVTGALTDLDCELDDNSKIDFWEFQGSTGQTVTVTMTSNQVDSFLFLQNPQSQVAAQNDDGAGGSNARIVFTLNTSGPWAIGANASPNQTGNYTLTLACAGTPTGGSVPAAPSTLQATAVSTTVIDLDWQDNSNNETSFVVQGRAPGQAFHDLGSVTAHSGTGSTGATITGLMPGTPYTFRVRASNANGDSPYSNEATATTLGGGGSGDFLTSSNFPDFRFRVRIIPPGGATIQGRKENVCIPDTLCVSGALAGRSEVFLRIIGPRPNGFLWPTIVRFTPSRVEVDIQQISTGILKTYVLPAVPPESDELCGLQDRMGFLP